MDLLRGFSGSYVGGVDPTLVLQYNYPKVGIDVLDQQANEHYESDGFEHSEGHMTNESEERFSQGFDPNEHTEELNDYILPNFDDEDHMDVWNEDSNKICLGMYFNSKNVVMYAIRRWNVGCNREIYVTYSKPSLWKARCKTTQPQNDSIPIQNTL
ncbi:hypothetical protein E3N88_00175 [Mikania micrantha]|uniref:Transposase MuDR plant domain-containing protein n=1 Tax=Mikania micrantha TaxID=192012 RepID=A0A5N6PXC9_9ASTR|nr:hypothetical protein E3N88_00175 [Mikania micrantha]